MQSCPDLTDGGPQTVVPAAQPVLVFCLHFSQRPFIHFPVRNLHPFEVFCDLAVAEAPPGRARRALQLGGGGEAVAGVPGGPSSSSCCCPSPGQQLESCLGQRWAPGPFSVHQPLGEARGESVLLELSPFLVYLDSCLLDSQPIPIALCSITNHLALTLSLAEPSQLL
ncbi:hypothetical protein CB1_000331009 [Camelus ferus]|nr:hypothetical protein CB1_000331009 [Camelus ferus]